VGSDWFLENLTLANRVIATCRTAKGEGEEESNLYGCHTVVLINELLALECTPPTYEHAAATHRVQFCPLYIFYTEEFPAVLHARPIYHAVILHNSCSP